MSPNFKFQLAWSKGMSVDNICWLQEDGNFPEAILKEFMESNFSANESEMDSTSELSSSTQKLFLGTQQFHLESLLSIETMLGVQNEASLMSQCQVEVLFRPLIPVQPALIC